MSLLNIDPNPESTACTLVSGGEISRRRSEPAAFRLEWLRSVKMHPVLASSVTVGTFVLFLLHALVMKPLYQAQAVIYEQPEPVRLVGETLTGTFDSARYDSFLQGEIQKIERPETISAALARLPRSTWADYGTSQQAATDGVLTTLKVGRVSTSYQVSLTLMGSNPRDVTDVLNAIVSMYLDSVRKQLLMESEERAALLAEERQRITVELRRTQQEQSALSASLGMANPDGEGDPYAVELAARREQSLKAQSAHDAVKAQLASLSGRQEGHGLTLSAAADEIISTDAGLSTLKSRISERRATLSGQMSGMTPDNPLRQRDEEELEGLDHSLEEMTASLRTKAERTLQEKLRSELQRTGDLKAQIDSELARRTVDATNATSKLQRAAEINGDLKHLLLRRAEIDEAGRNLELEVNRPGTARLALAAQAPVSPEKNRQRLYLIASLPLAFLLGSAAAVIAHKCDGRIYTGLDVDRVLNFPPVALLRACGESSKEVFEEDVFRMAGSVANASCTKGMRTFLFATVSSEIDIGPLSETLLKRLCTMGTDVLRTTMADLLLPLAPTWPIDPAISKSLEGDSFPPSFAAKQDFLNANLSALQVRHSVVLIEGLTLVGCAATEYVARNVDAVIVVAESAVTRRADLLYAVELLQRLQVPGVGVVLQGVRKRYTSPRVFRARRESSVVDVSHYAPQAEAASSSERIRGSRSSAPETMASADAAETIVESPQDGRTRVVTRVQFSPFENPKCDEAVPKDANCLVADLGPQTPIRPVIHSEHRQNLPGRTAFTRARSEQRNNEERTPSTNSFARPSSHLCSSQNSTPCRCDDSLHPGHREQLENREEGGTNDALPVVNRASQTFAEMIDTDLACSSVAPAGHEESQDSTRVRWGSIAQPLISGDVPDGDDLRSKLSLEKIRQPNADRTRTNKASCLPDPTPKRQERSVAAVAYSASAGLPAAELLSLPSKPSVGLENSVSSCDWADKSADKRRLSMQSSPLRLSALHGGSWETGEPDKEAESGRSEEGCQRQEELSVISLEQTRGSMSFEDRTELEQSAMATESYDQHAKSEKLRNPLNAAFMQPSQTDRIDRRLTEAVPVTVHHGGDAKPSLHRSKPERSEDIARSARMGYSDPQFAQECRITSGRDGQYEPEDVLTREWGLLSRFQQTKCSISNTGSDERRRDVRLEQQTKTKLSRAL